MTGATSATSPAKSASGKSVVFLYNAHAVNTGVHCPVLPVTIQLIMPHINLQLGKDLSDSSSPILCCVVDTAAALCTGNYHFFAAIAKQYPQCVAKIFLPEEYSPIVLFGIVQDNADAITTELLVAFQLHLPYFTKEGSTTSFVMATGPHLSVNTVLGLPLITVTGMILDLDFNDNVVQAKNLDCPPFPIDFCRTMKTIPAIKDDKGPKTHYIEFEDVQQILQKTNPCIAGVCERIQSVPTSTVPPSSATALARVCFDGNSRSSVSVSDTVTTFTLLTNRSIEHHCPPPTIGA
jgi:hypothetical protein